MVDEAAIAAAEACAAGRGGIALVSRITGISRSTINRGLAELGAEACRDPPSGRVRRAGGGRKKLTATDATLLSDLQGLVEPTRRGDPQAPLLWTSRSLRNLAEALQAMGADVLLIVSEKEIERVDAPAVVETCGGNGRRLQ